MIIESCEEKKSSRIISHIDFDYFYAQCEEIRRPEIKHSPVIICIYSGRTSDSGVVSTSNYIARKYGIKSGIPIKTAKSKFVNVPEISNIPTCRYKILFSKIKYDNGCNKKVRK